jgi:hypothetical protein
MSKTSTPEKQSWNGKQPKHAGALKNTPTLVSGACSNRERWIILNSHAIQLGVLTDFTWTFETYVAINCWIRRSFSLYYWPLSLYSRIKSQHGRLPKVKPWYASSTDNYLGQSCNAVATRPDLFEQTPMYISRDLFRKQAFDKYRKDNATMANDKSSSGFECALMANDKSSSGFESALVSLFSWWRIACKWIFRWEFPNVGSNQWKMHHSLRGARSFNQQRQIFSRRKYTCIGKYRWHHWIVEACWPQLPTIARPYRSQDHCILTWRSKSSVGRRWWTCLSVERQWWKDHRW